MSTIAYLQTCPRKSLCIGTSNLNDEKDKWVPLVAVLSPLICFILSENSERWLDGYKFGFELLILNGIITYAGLHMIRIKAEKQPVSH